VQGVGFAAKFALYIYIYIYIYIYKIVTNIRNNRKNIVMSDGVHIQFHFNIVIYHCLFENFVFTCGISLIVSAQAIQNSDM